MFVLDAKAFRVDGYLCDVVLKSQDGTVHRAHRNVLSAASPALKALLSGIFQEGERISAGGPVEVAASAGAVAGLLDYVYGVEPTVLKTDGVELFRLADAYELPHLATELETQLVASLDSSTALGFLGESSTLGTIQQACEDSVAADFERCSQQVAFLELPEWRLARLLKREDLEVQREEMVLQGLWKWIRASEDRGRCLGTMLQLIDLQSLSKPNLERLRLSAQSLGGHGVIIQTEVDAAIKKRLAISGPAEVRAKRRRLSHWSAELGAHDGSEEIHLKGQLKDPFNFCWHDGSVTDVVELFRLADAYELPHLATELETQLVASLDSSTALGLLRESSTLGTIQQACEDSVAADFERCSQQVAFLELPEWRLARLLKREDLEVQREEMVLQGLWKWIRASKDRGRCLGVMLQLIDLQSLSKPNLERLRLSAQSLGGHGVIIQTEVDAAIKKRLAISGPAEVRAKRRRLSHWSAELGAHDGSEEIHLKGQLKDPFNFCWHDGWIYIADSGDYRIVRWKTGTDEVQVVAGQGAPVNGVNDLSHVLCAAVSPKGEIVVSDGFKDRLVSFEEGRGRVLIEEDIARFFAPFFSPNGVLYAFSQDGVWRMDGATLRPVINSDDLPKGQQFSANSCAASRDEAIYITDVDNNRILRFSHGGSQVTIVGTAAPESIYRAWRLSGTPCTRRTWFSRRSGPSGRAKRLGRPPWT